MSPRAAWRLESLGFGEVYDYAAGKLDWMAAGLPTEGTNAELLRAGDVARNDVSTCGTPWSCERPSAKRLEFQESFQPWLTSPWEERVLYSR